MPRTTFLDGSTRRGSPHGYHGSMSQVTVPAILNLPEVGVGGSVLLPILAVLVVGVAIFVSIHWEATLLRFAAPVSGVVVAALIMSPLYSTEVARPTQHAHIIANLSSSADVTNLVAEPVPKVDSLHAPQDTPACTYGSKESHLPYSWRTTTGERVTGSIRKTAEEDGACTYTLSEEATP